MSLAKCPYCGVSVSEQDTFCNNCFWDLRGAAAGAPAVEPTIKQAPVATPPPAETEPNSQPQPQPRAPEQSFEPPRPAARPPQAKPKPAPAEPSHPPLESTDNDRAVAFRPRLRPPMALLMILDDDGTSAEAIRLRQAETTIGRSEGDVVIPHEKLMSGKHAKIARRFIDGAFRWFLVDLGSTNGTFAKASSCRLRNKTELMIGSFRYQFEAATHAGEAEPEVEAPPSDAPQRTMGWGRVNQRDMVETLPKLLRISPGGDITEFALPSVDCRLGSDPTLANLAIVDDPLLSSLHVRVHRDEHQRWFMDDLNSKNGLWVAIKEQELDRNNTLFQMGEQRFNIRFSK